jgi:hypothetical protein
MIAIYLFDRISPDLPGHLYSPLRPAAPAARCPTVGTVAKNEFRARPGV